VTRLARGNLQLVLLYDLIMKSQEIHLLAVVLSIIQHYKYLILIIAHLANDEKAWTLLDSKGRAMHLFYLFSYLFKRVDDMMFILFFI